MPSTPISAPPAAYFHISSITCSKVLNDRSWIPENSALHGVEALNSHESSYTGGWEKRHHGMRLLQWTQWLRCRFALKFLAYRPVSPYPDEARPQLDGTSHETPFLRYRVDTCATRLFR